MTLNMKNNLSQNFLMVILLFMSPITVYASQVYNFVGSDYEVRDLMDISSHEVWTNPNLGPGPSVIGLSQTASLTFTSALAPNTTTFIHAESGGYEFLGSTKGGLDAYNAASFIAITSDINQYVFGSAGGNILIQRYSALDGNVTTDANGNISAWILQFKLFDNPFSGGGFIIDTVNKTIDSQPGIIDAVLDISSNPASSATISNIVALNGVADTNNYIFNGADTLFDDPGSFQERYYTTQPGSFVPVNPVPEPSVLGLLIISLYKWRRLNQKSNLN
jgi:hypothetical protein